MKDWLIDKLRLSELNEFTDMDDPARTVKCGEIITKKNFLKQIYTDHYRQFQAAVSSLGKSARIIELGSGAGFIKDIIPNVITSEILNVPGVDLHFSALTMPFRNETLDAILMFDVLHHLPDTKLFFQEAIRCLKKGGMIVMIEPANTAFARLIWKKFHHEPFDPEGSWGFSGSGPLSCANIAIPWIVFSRDRKAFDSEFSSLSVKSLRIHTPLRHLLSGGFVVQQLVPSWSYNMVKGIEWLLTPFNPWIGLFMTIELQKVGDSR